jgi:hypothetical protein
MCKKIRFLINAIINMSIFSTLLALLSTMVASIADASEMLAA